MDTNKTPGVAFSSPAGSGEQSLSPVKASATVNIAPDSFQAEIYLRPPLNGGAHLSKDELLAILNQSGVASGIVTEMLDQLASAPAYDRSVIIARGRPAVEGAAAAIAYMFQSEKDHRPKEREDGTLDYKDLGIVQNVLKGQVLCVKTPAGPGEAGFTVRGAAIPARPGRDCPLPMGKNTEASADQLQLLASCDGQVDVVSGKVQVLNTFTVKGDVGSATGNIDFVGNVVINGNVLTGFRVQASGNITVNGCVEDAEVIAGGNVILKEGLNGGERGFVRAGGYLKAKYIQSGKVQAAGEVETTFIQHSTVQSGSSINLVGGRAVLAGGRAVARDVINAVFVGGKNSAVPTILEVGNDPATVNRYKDLQAEMKTNQSQAASLTQAINLLEEYERASRLDAEKAAALSEARAVVSHLTVRYQEMEMEMTRLREELSTIGYGTVHVKRSAYPGVRIVIGPEQVYLEQQYDYCTFTRGNDGITFAPYTGA